MPRVEAVRHFRDCPDVDVGGKLVVDLAAQRFRRERRVQLEVRNLRQGVDAGVGAAGPIQLEVLAATDLAHRAVDLTLNRASVLLDLPPAVSSARVLDQEPETRHASVWTGWSRQPAFTYAACTQASAALAIAVS